MDAQEVELIYELSPMQQAMLFHSLYAPGSGVYVIQQSLRLTGPLDVPALERAWRSLVERHGILRTAFFWEELEKPLQVVHRRAELRIARDDWRGLPADEQRRRLGRVLADDLERGFDLTEPPLLRLALYRLDEDVHQLVWSYHHLLSDGWSQGLLLQELFATYAAQVQGREPALPRPRPFRDYIAWLQRQDLAAAEAFWRRSLAGFASPTFVLEPDRPDGRPEGPRPEDSRRAVLQLSPPASAALRDVARARRLTLNTLVQGAWALLLARMTSSDDVVFGTTVSGRPADLPGVESILGLFINTLPVRIGVDPEQRLDEWLAALQQRQVEIRRFEHAPLVEVQRWSELPAGTPLFDHILVFENLALPEQVAGGVQGLSIEEESATTSTNFPLNVVVIPGPRLTLTALYDAARFHGAEALRLLERLAGVLAAFASAGRAPRLEEIPVLLEAERQQALIEWNDTRSAWPDTAALPELFEQVARETPDAPALIDPAGEVWSYRRLDEESSRLARRLRRLGVGPESAVGLSLERSAELILGTLAILKAGGLYVPLDASYPDERLAFMLEDTGARLVLVHAATRERLSGLVSILDVEASDWRNEPAVSPGVRVPSASLAYVIYTSGSTGRPKGVAVPHRAIVRLVRETNYVRLGPGDRTGQIANISFDAATYEIWGALLTGAAVAVIPREVVLSPADFARAIRERGVTSMFLTSALFTRMAREAPDAFATMSELLVGGEAVDPAAARAVLAGVSSGGPPRRLLNGYGPTESTTFASWHRIDRAPEGASIPIGRALANTTLWVLDRTSAPVPPGSPGELCIGGDGLAQGYLNRPGLTAERFIPHPWGSGERLYRTGDLVQQRTDGVVEYLGRLDHQVKIRGFRIEPGEIEAVLASHPEIRECAVLARQDAGPNAGELRLVAYVVTDAEPADLRAWLQERLPDYMVPTAWVVLDALPLTANGKLDRRALPAPERVGSQDADSVPSDPIEERLAAIWAEVLGLERVGVHDDFFALGGHSLLATQVVSRVRAAFEVELPLRELFESPTVAGLARVVRQSRSQSGGTPQLLPFTTATAATGGGFPLSFAQQRLWLIDLLEPGNPAYNVPLALRLTGDLSVPLLRRTFAEVIARHDALRTTFAAREGVPAQIVAAADPGVLPELPETDLSALPPAVRDELALQLAREEARRPFDLQRGPLLRLALLRLGRREMGEHLLLVTLHHIVSDGWSLGVLLREVGTLYAAFSRGLPSPLPPLPLQYADFAVWQREGLQGEVLEGHLAHWRLQLAGAPTVLELPTDRPRPAVRAFRGATRAVRIAPDLSAAVAALGRQEGATPFMVLLAAWGALLGRHAGQEDVLVGTPIAGRNRREVEDLIGFFVNTLVLRVDARGNPGFGELLGRVRRAALDAFAHQDLPFERLVEELIPTRDLGLPPLFQVMLAVQNAPLGELALPGLTLAPVAVDSGLAKLDLGLSLAEGEDGLAGALERDTDLFDAETVDRLWSRFQVLLAAAVADPSRPVFELPALLADEIRQVLREPNDTRRDFARDSSLPALFAAVAAARPDAPAVVEADGTVRDYRWLDEASNRLARHLRRMGVRPGALVGVSLERSAELVVALLAVLKAGAAYVPLDAGLPDERLAFLLQDTGAAEVLVHGPTRERFAGLARLLDLEDFDWQRGSAAASGIQVPAEALAYVIYTSGSTGRPKGVAVSHRAVLRLVEADGFLALRPDDRLAFNANPSFDAATWEIWATLLAGAALVVIPRDLLLSPAALAEHVERHRVTVLHLTAALFAQVARQAPEALARPRCVLFGGEASAPAAVAEALDAAQPQRLLQMYGPTESTTFATWYEVAEVPPEATTIPIGRPLENTTAYVLDPWQQPAPPKQPGELWLGGEGIAQGYWNRPGLTAERFLPDPWSTEPGGRLYRTGDLARRRPDGDLEFQGRIDHQVKIRGFRVEPGEVEAVLAALPEVAECVVLARREQARRRGEVHLVAYVVLQPEAREGDLRAALAERLPDYMVPAGWVFLEALPLTANGKVDRQALPAPGSEETPAGERSSASSDPIEDLLAGVWAEVLERDHVRVHDDFFALGGHSLLGARVMSRIREVLGMELPLRLLFEAPTVAQLARAVRDLRPETAALPLVPAPRGGDLPLSFAQQRLWLVDQLDPGSPAYNMPFPVRLQGAVDPALLRRVFAEVVARHEALRTTFAGRDGRPVQVISPFVDQVTEPPLPLLDLTALPERTREAAALALAREEARRPFDLRRGPLLRLALLRLAEREHALLMTLHHIISDGWSTGVLLREIAALVPAFSRGLPSPLPPLPVQSADFAVWQRGWLQGEVLDGQIAYWRQRLAGAPRLLELPTDRPRPPLRTSRGAGIAVALPLPLAEGVRATSRRQGATPFMALLAAWAVLLGRHAGQSDVLVGSPVAGRNRREIEDLIGFFVNTLVLRVNAQGNPGFGELLGRVRRTALDAFAHQDVPFERLVEELVPERDLAVSPLFQVMFALQNAAVGELTLPGLTLAPIAVDSGMAKFDLSLTLGERAGGSAGGFAGTLEHDTDLFDAATVERLWARFVALLEGAVADPVRPLFELPLLLADERQQVLLEHNDTRRDFSRESSLPARFAAMAAAAPDALALLEADGTARSYRWLDERSDRLARHLRREGVMPGALVGVALERSADLVVALLGILKAGAAYVPLDATLPDDRLAFLLEDTGAALVLVHGPTRERFAGLARRLDLEDPDWQREVAPGVRIPARVPAEALAYLIYTSGSTGRPKGVAVSHRAVLRLVEADGFLALRPDDRLAFNANPSFDAATWEIWATLLAGAALVVIPRDLLLSPAALAEHVERHRVTVLHLTAALFAQVARQAPEALARPRCVLFGGEASAPAVVAEALDAAQPQRLLQMYGPTESTTFATWYEVAEVPPGATTIPIGRPLENTTAYVLDPWQQPAPPKQPGELWLGGEGIAQGYWNRPGLTAERFLPDPWSAEPGGRLYRTGDLVRRRPDGDLEFQGRIDHQVKIRGFRVEPGEVEAVLAALPEVAECVVLARRHEVRRGGEVHLAAYVVPRAETRESDLRAALAELLPDYMIPASWTFLEALPLTPNGKVDRQALPVPEAADGREDGHAAPADPVEELLAGVWAEVLGLDRVGVHDDFFALGGHSLLGARVVSRIRAVLGVELPLRRLFEAPTVARLARVVRELRPDGAALAPLVPVPRAGDLPLSFAQQRLWLVDQIDPGSPAYNMPFPLRLRGAVDPLLLRRVFAAVVARHEALRTTFEVRDGQPVQVIAAALAPELPLLDLASLPAEAREAAALELARAEARRPFDLRRGPLLRLTLLRLAGDEHVLLLTLHHIVSDGWSMGVLLREIAALHPALLQGRPAPLPELPVQYADFAVWQRDWMRGEVLRRQLDHWRDRLDGAPRVLELPVDRPRSPLRSFRGAALPVALPPSLADAVREVCRRQGVTPFMALVAAWALLLGRHAGQEDVLVGTPIAGRNRREIEDLIGFFVNTLVLRVDAQGSPGFGELLERVRGAALDAFAHQDLPFERLVEELVPERDLAVTPLFQVMFALQNTPVGELALPGLSIAPVAVDGGLTKFDLSLSLGERGDGFTGGFIGTLEHDTDLFDTVTAARLWDRFEALLAAAVADPGRAVDDLPVILPAERHQTLVELNDTRTGSPRESCLAELFAEVARRHSEEPAILAGDEVWSYGRLDAESNRLARHLIALGVGPETAVGIAMEPSPELLLGTLAIVKAGGLYVPLDAGYPDERLAFLLADTGARLALVHAATRDRLALLSPVLDVEEADWRREGAEPLDVIVPAECLAYVIYTSGSTGRPKGVGVTHRAIARLVRDTDYVRLGPGDRVGQVANISFDAATYEIWGALLTGAAAAVISREVVLSPGALAAALREHGITSLFLTSALFARMAREVPDAFATLSELMTGGEVLDRAAARAVLASRPPRRLLHVYGPTESTTFATWHPIREVVEGVPVQPIPIGRALANTTLFVLDRMQAPVPPGAAGELCLGGDGLARGYLHRPELTAERFVPHPWDDGGRLYRTGDLVRQRQDGAIEFLGRLDHQVKIRGFRIEPGEIEALLAVHPEVRACAVLVRQDAGGGPGEKRLVAYAATEADPAALRAWLRERLPDYMVPSAIVTLEALPVTANGKLDRRALPAPERSGSAGAGDAPGTPLEELVAGVWAEVLGVERVGVHDDFFALGGHSLLATQVMSRLREVVGVELPLRRLFEGPTVAQLARIVQEARRDQGGQAPPLVPVPRGGDLPLSFAQQRLWLIDRLDPDSPAYDMPFPLRLRGAVDPLLLRRIFAEIGHRHEALRTTFGEREGRPVQVIAPCFAPDLPLLDLTALPDCAREAAALDLARADAARPFDLRRGPLLRLALVRLGARDHVLLLNMHHVVSDGWSMGVLLREVAALHEAFSQGRPSPLPALPVQYADFAVWQRAWLQGEVLSAQLEHWKQRLAGAPRVLDLPTDRPRPAVQTFRGASRPVALSAPLADGVRALCRQAGATPFMVLLAAWALLLGRHAGQRDVLLGTPIAGRNRRETEGLIGFFVNTLVLRVDATGDSGGPGFAGLLERVREAALDAFGHQDVPFERLVEELVPERDLAMSPLFQVMFALQNAPMGELALPGLTLAPVVYENRVAKFDLSLSLAEGPLPEGGEGFAGSLDHNVDLFDAVTMTRLWGRFEILLRAAAADPGQPVADLPLLLPTELQQVLVEPTANHDLPPSASVPELFLAQAAATPDALAVVSSRAPSAGAPAEDLTYAELADRSARLASVLRGLGVGPEARVGICAGRTARRIVGLLAVLRAGGAYVPVDPAWPADRLALVLGDAGVELVLTDRGSADRLPPGTRAVFLEDEPAAPADHPGPPLEPPRPTQAAYVIYTSGSTGRPKGVVAHHAGLAAFSRVLADAMELTPADRMLQYTSLSFDASAVEIWPPLIRGAAVAVHPDPTALAGRDLRALAEREGWTVMNIPGAPWRQVVQDLERTGERAGQRFGPPMRLFLTGGESLTPEVLRQWRRTVVPEMRLLSCYGPTETTVIIAVYPATGEEDGALPAGAPLGSALPGTGLYLLDERLSPVPLGVPGEIFLGGAGVTRGYLGQPERTAATFLPDPWGPPGARLYRTGDRARLRTDGGLEFLGRIDLQVKIRGIRVEPGEVETVLAGHPAVRECAVLARRDAGQGGGAETRLVAYAVLHPGALADSGQGADDPRSLLRGWLRERVPEALVPSAFVVLDAFPQTTSGKIDRQALPAPERPRGTDAEHVPPSDPLEEMLAGIWEELLGVDRVGIHDDFFALGGHSLLATQVLSRVRDLLGVELPLRELFARPTVAALARLAQAAQREGGGRVPPVVPVAREEWPDGLPLSFAQQRLWFLHQLEPGNTAYHMPQAVRLTGKVSADLLERIFAAIVERHEALRTTFAARGERPAQVIAPPGDRPVLRVIDLSGLPEAEREERALALARQEAARPFDLGTGPLLRQTLLRLETQDHLLLLTLHHIVSDGWSMGVLIGEIAELYRALSAGEEPRLPALPVQYADYAVWQRGWLQGEVLEAELAWWRGQLAGLPPLLELPTDRPRPPVQSFRGGQLGLRLPVGLSDRLRAFAHREGATLFMALLAGFQALLARCSNQDQVAVGSPIAGRNHLEIERLIGFFVNTLVLRGDLSGAPVLPGYRELVGRARERALGAYAHQEVPFEKLVEELAPQRSLAHAPLFQVMLVLQNTGEQGLALEGLRLRPVDTGSVGAKFDLTLSLSEHGGQILGGLTYASDLFDAVTLRRFLERFERLLEAALAAPATPWTELPLLSPAEAGQLFEWTDTAAPVPLERLLHERIADRARETPERDAVDSVGAPDGRLSFAALDRRANQLAHRLIALGVVPESRVALCMDRSVDLVVGLLAALRAGAAFVVVDPAQPLPRLSRTLRDAAPAAVLTREPAGAGLPEDLPDDLGAPVLWLDREAAEISRESERDPRVAVDPEQAAYVVYTSGSTGTPKGVVVRHGAVLNLLAALERTVYAQTGPGLRVSVNAPLYFDGAIKQVIQLAQGRTLCLVPDEVRADAEALGRFLAERRVDVLDCTPAQLRALLDSGAPLPSRLLVGGEAVDQALWDRLARLPGTASFNVYGPSECTVDTTARRIAPDAPRPVLGRPLVNVRTHVMAPSLLPQPPGLPGELWIGGAGVARGYLGRPDLTAERFVPDPFSGEPGARLYRTGDLVRWSPEGELEFLGRVDHQVKVRGFRIELGEIETALAGHPAVRDCAVLAREERSGDRRLVAWVALQESGAEADPAALTAWLRAWLRERLPAYMVPSGIGVLTELPLTPNGKVDRRALAGLALERPADEDRYVPPADPVEEMLAGIWAEVLGVDRVGSRDSFFELGGHSLLATRVTSRVRAQLGIELPLRALFESPTLADLARAVRAAQERETTAAPPLLPIPPAERGATFPLSFAQQRLWFLDQVEPGNPAYNIPLPVRVRGELPADLLERIFAEITARHEALRTTFTLRDGAPAQVVHAELRPELRRFDLSGLPEAEREERARRLVADEARRPFDLAAGPLVRLTLVKLGERDQILLLTLHHIVSDGWSMGVLLREIGLLLEAFNDQETGGQPSPLPPLSLQYADFAVWQRGWLHGDVLREQLDHWKTRLAGAPQVLELPTDRPRPPVQTFQGAAVPVVFPAMLAEGVRALCRREGTTPFMALLAAWAVLLGRHAGQDDLLLGSPVAGRNRRETEELIGLFINTLVLRADLREESGPLSFRELLARVRETALDAFAHQDVPFERLVEELVEERNLAVSPLFQVLLTLQNTPRAPFQPSGLTLEPVEVESGVAKVDLSLTLSEGAAGIVGALEHNTDLFDRATAERLVARFGALLEAAAADPGRALDDLPLLLPAELEQALSVWNPVSAPPRAACLHELIFRQAARTPDAVAVSGAGEALTYRELEARSHQMAHHLRSLGVTAETPVGVRLERSPGLLVALLGILEAGGAYVPLDPAWPAERTAFVLAAAGVSLVLDRHPEIAHLPARSLAPAADSGRSVDPGQLAYVLFTSGSTGAPKGVMVRHASVTRYLEWCVEAYGLAPGRRSLLHSPLGFDLTVTALFAPLLAGGEVRLVPESAGMETIQELTRALEDGGAGGDVQLLKLTPAHLEILGGELEPAAASRVATLVVGGDALRGEALGVWRTGAPATRVVNEYGPTEATVGCCVHIAPAGEIADGRVPIGHPIDGARLHVVDRHLRLLPPGARGELLIGGDGLARGYLGRPDLTAERFLPDPWALLPGDRLYRTGDLVVRRTDGSLDYLGRNDHQVKVRGFRIELGEIEAVLGRSPEVRDVVVTVREDVPGDRLLAAYVVCAGDEAAVDGLRSFAAERLPSYMVPAVFVPLGALPLTPNGKVDRRALPAPERARSGPPFIGPRDTLELDIARIWEELLNVRPVGVRDDFFALGGHSLLAAQLTARLRGHFGREIPLVALLRAPTVERLAALLRNAAPLAPAGTLVELASGPGQPLFLVHPVGGEVLSYVHLARHLSSAMAVYGLRLPDDAAPPETVEPKTIEEMAAGYLREIREVQPEGPYALGGWSLGGVVAFEMARQLEAQGESVEAVVLIDSFAPGAVPAAVLSEGALVAAFAFDLARGLGLELAGPPADLDGLAADEALRRLAERAEAAGLLPPGLRLEDLERRFARFAANLRASERYAGGESGARLLLIRASERPAGMAPPPADLGWNRLARRPIETHELPGDHYRLLQEPGAGTLAALIRQRLAHGSTWIGLLPDTKTDTILQMEEPR